AAAAVAAPHARVRLLAGVSRPRRRRRDAHALCRDRAVQVQGVEARRVRRAGEESRLLRQGPAASRQHPLRGHRGARDEVRGAAVGASMQPKPYGVWGLMEKDLNALPGYGKAADDKTKARKLFAEAGYGPQNPLKIEMATRNIPIYVDFASFVINELKQVGVEATLKQVDTAQWHPLA